LSDKITAKRVDDKVVIEMPISILKCACENNPEYPLHVVNEEEFAQYIVDNVIEFDEDEAGNTAFYRLLDNLFEKCYEDGGPLASDEDLRYE
jgi:hypothetical protein